MTIEPDDPREIGVRLQWLREHLGLTIQEFAQALGVKYDRYYNWESGRGRLSFEGAKRINRDYSVPLDFLYLGVPSMLPSDLRKSWLAFHRDARTS